ncbi:MAG: hypothetical protein LBK46_00875, partial [Oscillospiraceae bacterium]|nr:hypothetical protein [Oscillospiraceae bacterium]
MKTTSKRIICVLIAAMLFAPAAMAVPNSEIVGSAVIEKHSFGANLSQLPIVPEGEKVTFVLWKPLNSTVMQSYEECILYDEL